MILLAGAAWILPMRSGPAANGSGAAIPSHAPLAAAAVAPPAPGPRGDGLPPANDARDMRWVWGTVGPTPPSELTGYVWPIHNARITNGYGKGRPGSFEIDGVTTHDGLDLATFCGDRIVAAHDGTVLVAGRHNEGFMGWLGDLTAYRAKIDADRAWSGQAIAVVIDDGNDYHSVYVHLGRAVVRAGDHVRAGELIGYEGATGNATGCHLHYALFSPLEPGWLALDPKVVERTHLPDREIARIDPLLVLPPLDAAGITWAWGARTDP